MTELPEKIGKYHVVGIAGRGNMGIVYIGYDPFSDADVAIKTCEIQGDPEGKANRVARKLFFNEAHMAGVLDHPNILRIFDAGEEDDEPYIVMEYLDGGNTLMPHCEPKNLLPIARVAEIAFKCSKALDYAHRRGVIHRDIKPSNIMLTADGDVKIGDFGIAQRPMEDSTHVMGIMGSPRYMSPEQVQDRELTSQTDIYSLGVVIYQLLTGTVPFSGNSLIQLTNQICDDPLRPMRELRPEIPEALDLIVAKAMNKEAAKRFRNGADMAQALVKDYGLLETEADVQEVSDHDKYEMVRRLPFFNEFSDEEVREVIRVGDWENFSTAQTIITEGSAETSFCVLVSGDVAVNKKGHDLTTLNPGDCFGEMGFLTKTKRTASIRAVGDVAILRINETQMEHALESCQLRFNKVFLRTLIQRLEKTSDDLSSREGADASQDRSGQSSADFSFNSAPNQAPGHA